MNDDAVRAAIECDRNFQPQPSSSRAAAALANKTEGKKVRRILTTYFDP